MPSASVSVTSLVLSAARISEAPIAIARTRCVRESISIVTSTASGEAPSATAASKASRRIPLSASGVGLGMTRSTVSRTSASATPIEEMISASSDQRPVAGKFNGRAYHAFRDAGLDQDLRKPSAKNNDDNRGCKRHAALENLGLDAVDPDARKRRPRDGQNQQHNNRALTANDQRHDREEYDKKRDPDGHFHDKKIRSSMVKETVRPLAPAAVSVRGRRPYHGDVDLLPTAADQARYSVRSVPRYNTLNWRWVTAAWSAHASGEKSACGADSSSK